MIAAASNYIFKQFGFSGSQLALRGAWTITVTKNSQKEQQDCVHIIVVSMDTCCTDTTFEIDSRSVSIYCMHTRANGNSFADRLLTEWHQRLCIIV